MNPEFRLWLTSKRTIIRSSLSSVFFLLAYLVQQSKSHSQGVQFFGFVSYVLALYFGVTCYPSTVSYKSEFKNPISPIKFYAVKTLAIVITVILIIVLGGASYLSITCYCSFQNMNLLIALHAAGLIAAVILSALIGESIQKSIFNQIDKP